jgi:DNA-binding NarL/FixJ family response regulator
MGPEVMVSGSARILVVDDDDFTRTLVGSLVRVLGHEVCGSASAVTEAMATAHEVQPDAAVLDLDLGEGPTGIDLAHGLRRLSPTMGIVILSSYGDPTWMGQRREAPSGSCYVVKGSVNDDSVLGDALTQVLADPLRAAGVAAERVPMPLSAGQWEILRLVAAGHTNAEIARRRSLTEDAVNKAVSRLVRQLGIDPTSTDNSRVLLAQAYHRLSGTVSDRRD